MNRVKWVVAGWSFLLAIYCVPMGEAAEEESIELILRFGPTGLALVDQRVREGAAPKHRNPEAGAHQLLLECDSAAGEILGEVPVDDPRVVYQDWFEQGELRGGRVTREEGVFSVIVPFSVHLDHVTIKRRDRTMLGSCPIDRGKIQAYLKNKGSQSP